MRNKITFRIVTAIICTGVVLSAVCGFLVPQEAGAQGAKFGLQPVSLETGRPLGRLAYGSQPGETIRGGVKVISYSNSQLELGSFGTMATTASRGGVSLPEEPSLNSL